MLPSQAQDCPAADSGQHPEENAKLMFLLFDIDGQACSGVDRDSRDRCAGALHGNAGAKSHLLQWHLILKMIIFTKTGSGQT